MPSMMRMPQASCTAAQVAFGSVSPAETHARSDVRSADGRSSSMARYAVGAVARTVIRWRSTASRSFAGDGCSSR